MRQKPFFKLPHISAAQVLEEINNLDVNSSNGYDNISALFTMKCAEYLCVPLSDLFNLSIKHGVYLDILKYNNAIPIYKKGLKKNVENYKRGLYCSCYT